jgi:hypothetical protein
MTDAQRAIELVKGLMSIVGTLRHDIFKLNVDYGVIPGTSDKPVLLLPGMEKLLRALRLRPEYHALSIVEDFDKPLFVYRYECRLFEIETGLCVSTAIGSANSYEQKWRYRNAKRVCPECGKTAIVKGKAEYGGGWVCFKKQDGCGAKFSDGDPAIERQEVGRVENADIFDQINTIDKIAQKRAMSSAIKGAANVSEFFTVDLDDFEPIPAFGVVVSTVDTDTGEIVPPPPQKVVPKSKQAPSVADPSVAAPAPRMTPPQWTNDKSKQVQPGEEELDGDLRVMDDAKAFVSNWRLAGLDDGDMLAALGVERLSAWDKGRKAADAAMNAYIEANTSKLAETA